MISLSAPIGTSSEEDISFVIPFSKDPASCSVIHVPVSTTSKTADSIIPRIVAPNPSTILPGKQSRAP